MLRLGSKTLVARLAAQQARTFHARSAALAAKIYDMPAMSPTMESGAIIEWNVKEGGSFASGESLLEIETDKSTISVDAIDDGILAKILIPNGTKDIPVGTPIAIVAEEGDDLATLEYPELPTKQEPHVAAPAETAAPVAAAAPTPVHEATPAPTPAPAATPESSSVSTKANPRQRLFPSVELLLHQNHISEADAFEKIPATGPHGRILKGDVLAYLGKISAKENIAIAQYLEKGTHMDLSNVKPRETAKAAKAAEVSTKTETKKSNKPEPVIVSQSFPLEIEVAYHDLKSFKEIIATVVAETEQEAYAHNLVADSDLNDPLFDALVAPPRNADRFKIDYKVNYEDGEINGIDISLTLNPKCFDAKDRANYFIAEFKDNLAVELAELEN